MFVHVKRTQATLGLSVVFATVAMVRTDRALPCNLFDRRRVLQYAAQVLQYAAFSAAVRARTPVPSPGVAVRCIKCCGTLHQGPQYASITYRAMHQVPQYALGPGPALYHAARVPRHVIIS